MENRSSEEQIIGLLKEADQGLPVKELCRKRGFSEASFYRWHSKYCGMSVSDAKRLKALEGENAMLKKLLAESLLNNDVTREARQRNGNRPGVSRVGAVDASARVERAVTSSHFSTTD